MKNYVKLPENCDHYVIEKVLSNPGIHWECIYCGIKLKPKPFKKQNYGLQEKFQK